MYLSAPDPQSTISAQIKDEENVATSSERGNSDLNEVASQEGGLTLSRK